MQIAEIFYSVQGEGRLIGVPSVFIRTSGCNLRCGWCDTPYTSWRPEGRQWSIDEILEEVGKYPSRFIVLTGGEPFLAPQIAKLTEVLKQSAAHITIETAATIFQPVACDLLSMSPKLANSTPWKKQQGRFAKLHDARRLDLAAMAKFLDRYDCQIKFVVDRPADFDELRDILAKLKKIDPAACSSWRKERRRGRFKQRRHGSWSYAGNLVMATRPGCTSISMAIAAVRRAGC